MGSQASSPGPRRGALWLVLVLVVLAAATSALAGHQLRRHVPPRKPEPSGQSPRPSPEPTGPSQKAPPARENRQTSSAANTEVKPSFEVLKSDLETLISREEGTYAIYVEDLQTGRSLGIRARDPFTAASCFKVPLALYVYRRALTGAVDLDETFTYEPDDWEGGTGKLQFEEPWSAYPVRELTRLALSKSDNVATNILLRHLGKPNVRRFMRKIGGEVISENENLTSARDMAVYLKGILRLKKESPQLGGELINYLENTDFHDRIPAGLPDGTRVAHKIGTQVRVVNDAAIVLLDKRPYIVVVLSKNVDEARAPEVLAAISSRVYEFFARLSLQ